MTNTATKTKLILIFLAFYGTLFSQDPYLSDVSGNGIGQYGYCEESASTFHLIESNTHSVQGLAARWWDGSSEYVYYTGVGAMPCQTKSLTTIDYVNSNHPDWNVGDIAYVSILAEGCGGSWNPCFNGCTGYNERQFKKIDVNTAYTGTLANTVVDNPTGTQNLIGTFTIDVGNSPLTLDRLWLENISTAQETSDIPNDGIYIYYEDVTGTETYDGTESSAIIYGDYNSNSTTNNEFGHDDLNITIPAVGLRIYVVVNDLNDAYAPANKIRFRIMNDGMSFEENLDGHNLVRIGETVLSGVIDLPVELIDFRAKAKNNAIVLEWRTLSEINNDYFEVQKSSNGIDWEKIGHVVGVGTTQEITNYKFIDNRPFLGNNYYRLKQVDFDGTFDYSEVVIRRFEERKINIYPNPVKDFLFFETKGSEKIKIYNHLGQLILTEFMEEKHQLDVSNLPNGLYFVFLNNHFYPFMKQD